MAAGRSILVRPVGPEDRAAVLEHTAALNALEQGLAGDRTWRRTGRRRRWTTFSAAWP